MSERANDERLALQTIVAFRRADKALREHEGDVIASFGLTPSQFGALDALYQESPLRVGQIIERTLSTSGNTTVVIRNLERDGYARRAADPVDGRSCLIHLTEAGRALMEAILPEHTANVVRMTSGLTASEKRRLVTLLGKLSK